MKHIGSIVCALLALLQFVTWAKFGYWWNLAAFVFCAWGAFSIYRDEVKIAQLRAETAAIEAEVARMRASRGYTQ